MTIKIIYKKNDQTVEVIGLAKQVRQADGTLLSTYLNAATVTATLKDPSGNNVAGLTNLTLAFIAASSGIYRGQVEETFDPAQKDGYVLHIDAAEGGLVGHWEFAARVEIRRS